MRCASPPDSDSADAAEREVVETDVDEEAQALAHFLENRTGDLGIEPGLAVAREPARSRRTSSASVIGELDDVADVLAVDRDRERLGLEAPAARTRCTAPRS